MHGPDHRYRGLRMRNSLQALLSLLTVLHLVDCSGRQIHRQGHRRRRPTTNRRPTDAGGITGIINGIELNLLDSKMIGLGFVRQDLVTELCNRASNQLLREGIQRARNEASVIVRNLTLSIDDRCESLVSEGNTACNNVLGDITERFSDITQEAVSEGDKQCDATQTLAVDMVKRAAESTYNSTIGLGRQLAENEFLKQVEQQKNRGERMFHQQAEEGRQIAENELRRRIVEGRKIGEKNFTRQVEEGKKEAERIYNQNVVKEKINADNILQMTLAEEVAKAEDIFQEMVAKGRSEAERIFSEQSAKAVDEGEKMCTDMITIACTNVTADTPSDDFCLEFLFFTSDLGDFRLKRRIEHLYGSFYNNLFS